MAAVSVVALPYASEEPDADLREQLSNLQGLLVLSMLMTEAGDERKILHLASTAVPSLGRSRLWGVHLHDSGWRSMTDGPAPSGDGHADLAAQLAVLGSADPQYGEQVLAVVVPKAGRHPAWSELAGFARDHLASFKVPRRWKLAAELPHNAAGKIQKHLIDASGYEVEERFSACR